MISTIIQFQIKFNVISIKYNKKQMAGQNRTYAKSSGKLVFYNEQIFKGPSLI